ncbi:SAM-dependent methyltransferase [Allokutzneria sp. A3M-2-11 16]|uniref:SAM-dependent methyltransferase n=1 Tax=Allokutzneria sp. A3M-2-11 16 TaxID=2962043 RepID=UPI0020B68045|nr:SAM-dependent methyltransferase [Allokutzneria sp. A3M-2-11 16]MCP3799294.1 SAM-dependent methyltransferase [Allokutzneria sp. A3M-2-11 16]
MDWVPEDIDLTRPSAARMYDYFLGGSHNFSVDREAAAAAEQALPGVRLAVRANRSFLRRAVKYLVGKGIRQFLDLGSGIPTVGNVHEIAQGECYGTRVVYVDIDPIAVGHGRRILADNPDATSVRADLRDPLRVLEDPEVRALLDLDQPLAVLMVAVLHFVPDAEDPWAVVAGYLDRLVPGSHLVLSHGTNDDFSDEENSGFETVRQVYQRTSSPIVVRTEAEVAAFFTGLELVPPGLVRLSDWRPDSVEQWKSWRCGIGRKPGPIG